MPRPKTSRGHGPSPLAREVHLRPLSVQQENMTTPDLLFWKRFSTAIHEAEEADPEKGRISLTSASTSKSLEKPRDEWLIRQRQKKRRCRVIAWSITGSVCLLIIAGAVAGWYFTSGPGKENGKDIS